MAEDGGTITLKEFVIKLIEDIKAENDKRFAAQEKAVETAFNAAKEAVIKSEIGVEKRSDAVYVTIAKLQDSLISVMPRAEAEQRFNSVTEKLTEITDRANITQGNMQGSTDTKTETRQGSLDTRTLIFSLIAAAIAILSFVKD